MKFKNLSFTEVLKDIRSFLRFFKAHYGHIKKGPEVDLSIQNYNLWFKI